jgi:ABC-type molybdenum transport system ATPase subunit/photorepair protein PhrA
VTAPEETGTLIIPEGEKILHRSELFDVIVRGKHKSKGLVRDRYTVSVELIEQDPMLERIALMDIPYDVWSQLSVGERVKARLYEQPDKKWTTKPPSLSEAL